MWNPPCRDRTNFGSGLNTVEINETIANIFKSEPIQYIHKNRYGESQDQVMRMLQGDISKDGMLNDPSKWGIKNRKSEDCVLLFCGFAS